MMKLLLRPNPNGFFFSFRSFCNATQTLPTDSKDPTDSLYRRITTPGDRTGSAVTVLDQWIDQGKQVQQMELRRIIKQLRSFKRFKQAFEISQWMSNQGNLILSHGDYAVELDLVSKVQGLEQMEEYFDNIPTDMRGYQVYGALLNCYTNKKSLEKAEAIMQKMRDLGFLKAPLPYNGMLKLYSNLGKYEKMDSLLQEMEGKGIHADQFTYSIRLNALTNASDIEGMETLLMKMECDPHITMDWHAYVIVANVYLKAGSNEKAMLMLKRSEQLVFGKNKKLAYEVLLTLYAAAGGKTEVYHIWSLYKNMGKFYNAGYLSMISALLKLDDIDGAEKIAEEWESGHSVFDPQVRNQVINYLVKKGMLEKAEAYTNGLTENGKVLDATIWDCLATGYRVRNQLEKAVETMRKAILASRPERNPHWKLNLSTADACLDFLKRRGDVEVATELLSLLNEHNHLSEDNYRRLTDKINNESSSSTNNATEMNEQTSRDEADEPPSTEVRN